MFTLDISKSPGDSRAHAREADWGWDCEKSRGSTRPPLLQKWSGS